MNKNNLENMSLEEKIKSITCNNKIYNINDNKIPNNGGVYLIYKYKNNKLIFAYIGETESFNSRARQHFLNITAKNKKLEKKYNQIKKLVNDDYEGIVFCPVILCTDENDRYKKELICIRFLWSKNKDIRIVNKKINNKSLRCKYGYGKVVTNIVYKENLFLIEYRHSKSNSCNCRGYIY